MEVSRCNGLGGRGEWMDSWMDRWMGEKGKKMRGRVDGSMDSWMSVYVGELIINRWAGG